MKLFSTRTHGVLDYLSVGALIALPRVLGWKKDATSLLTGAALGTLGYSLLTNYELGAIGALSMKAHLALDAMSGAMLCAAPLLLSPQNKQVNTTLVGLGLFELAAATLTEKQ